MDMLSMRLDYFPTKIIKDQQELEKRITQKDPKKFLAIAYRITEKKLLENAYRRCQYLKQSIAEQYENNEKQESNKKNSNFQSLPKNKDIV